MRICVFAGSKHGNRPEFTNGARILGHELVAHGLEMVYGGTKCGLMGEVASAVLEGGGKVIGVLSRDAFSPELAHDGLTELYEVKHIHEGQALMTKLADMFIALPGGIGTFDEILGVILEAQTRLHSKPIGLLNIADYFTLFISLIEHITTEAFLSSSPRFSLIYENDPFVLLDRLLKLQKATPSS